MAKYKHDPSVLKEVGALYRKYRKAKGWTQLDLAKMLGISKAGVSGVELGYSHPHKVQSPRWWTMLELSSFDRSKVKKLLKYQFTEGEEEFLRSGLVIVQFVSTLPDLRDSTEELLCKTTSLSEEYSLCYIDGKKALLWTCFKGEIQNLYSTEIEYALQVFLGKELDQALVTIDEKVRLIDVAPSIKPLEELGMRIYNSSDVHYYLTQAEY